MMLPAFARNSALTFFCAVLVFLFPGSPQPLARSSDDKTALQREALLSSQAPRASQAQPLGQTKTEKLANPLNDLLDEAQRDIDEKKFAAAIPPLEKVLADQPDLAYGHFQLAYVYTALKKPKEAQAEYERAARLDPRMSAAYVNLGMLLLENHDETAAVAPLRKAVELLPAESRPRYLLAVALDRSGDRAGAAQAFAALLDLDPNEVHALEYLGWTSLRSGKPAEAEVRFRRALEVQPKGAHGLRGLAESLEAQKKPEAVAAYREYLEINPDDTRAHARLIRLLMDQGQNDAQLRGGLGRTFLQVRDFPNAEKELKTAIQLDAKNIDYWKDLSTTYYLSKNYAATLVVLDHIDQFEAPGAGSWFLRALCYDSLNQPKPALDAYQKFLELDQDKNPNQVWQAQERSKVLRRMLEGKK